METYCDVENCKIVREYRGLAMRALLLGEEGKELASFDACMRDSDILDALRFANRAYVHGTATGAAHKQHEIRKVLGL